MQRIPQSEIEACKKKRKINQDRQVVDTTESLLRNLPPHNMQCYMILKHMKLRDGKIRLLRILNFYRSVQKRIVLELRDFSNREVLNNTAKMTYPHESFYIDNKA